MLLLGLEPRLIESKPIVMTTYTKRAFELPPAVQKQIFLNKKHPW